MEKIEGQDELITILAQRAKFTKSDIKIIFNELINLMEELVFTDDGNFPPNGKPKVLLRVRDFGVLKISPIPERKGNDGRILPPSTKVTFTLSERLRFAGRGEKDVESALDEEEDM